MLVIEHQRFCFSHPDVCLFVFSCRVSRVHVASRIQTDHISYPASCLVQPTTNLFTPVLWSSQNRRGSDSSVGALKTPRTNLFLPSPTTKQLHIKHGELSAEFTGKCLYKTPALKHDSSQISAMTSIIIYISLSDSHSLCLFWLGSDSFLFCCLFCLSVFLSVIIIIILFTTSLQDMVTKYQKRKDIKWGSFFAAGTDATLCSLTARRLMVEEKTSGFIPGFSFTPVNPSLLAVTLDEGKIPPERLNTKDIHKSGPDLLWSSAVRIKCPKCNLSKAS